MQILKSAADQLAALFPGPAFIPEESFLRFWHEEPTSDLDLAAFLKAVRIVNALNASLILPEKGFVQELEVLFRTIDEFLEDVVFLLVAPPTEHPRDAL